MTLLAPTLQAFFTERLITQRAASPQTIAAYRDTFRLLLSYIHEQTSKQPCELDFADLDAPLIGAFLQHLETDRGNSARTRNARLAAITRSTATPRSGILSTPRASHGSSRSRPNATNATPSTTWPPARSPRCSQHPTAPPGSAAATTPCC